MTLQSAAERLAQFYERFDADAVTRLHEIYHPEIVFEDPVRRLAGLPALQDYFSGLLLNVIHCRFEMTRLVCSDGLASLEWRMDYAHPRLKSGRSIALEGVSLVQGLDRIDFQRDYYDLGALLYEHLPLLGPAVRHLKRRLGA